MSRYQVLAIPTKVAERVRETGKAPGYGHPAHTEVAAGYGPCRHCLRTFRIGEERRTLFTYDPFFGIEDIPLPGPIFIHADRCERYPENGGYPQGLLQHAAIFNAYSKGQHLISRLLIEANDGHEAKLNDLLEKENVDYVEVRDREAGCFDFRIQKLSVLDRF